MKKKLIFCLCIALSIMICMSTVPFSAYTYECDVEVTSSAVFVVNTDTGTVVYDKNSNITRYSSYLCNIMTFILVYSNVKNLDERITITQPILDKIENSDGSLKKFLNHTLTIRDLLYYLMMTNGTDAAYVLADYVTNGDIEQFVTMMNRKAATLGCTKTKFSAPGVMFDASQVTTCRDMYKIYLCALDIPDFTTISSTTSYMPEKYKNTALELQSNNSILRNKSPYYFKYIEGGKYGYDTTAKGNLAVHSLYKDVEYVCIILGAESLHEHNAFTETKQLLTWTYTTLGNKRIISADEVIATADLQTSWGSTQLELVVGKDIERTMPGDFTMSDLSYEYISNGEISAPVFKGQNVGAAKILYKGELFEEIDLVSNASYGVGMVDDITSFIDTMILDTFGEDGVEQISPTQPANASKSENTQAVDKNTKNTSAPTQVVESTQAVQ